MAAERVRRGDDGVVRDQAQRPRSDAVVLADDVLARAELLAAGERAPQRHGSEHVVRRERDEDEPGDEVPSGPQPGRAEHGGGDEPGDGRSRVVEVDRLLRARRREQVGEELGQRGRGGERREERQRRERQQELEQVRDAVAVEHLAEHAQRIGDERLGDPERAAADLAVATVERR